MRMRTNRLDYLFFSHMFSHIKFRKASAVTFLCSSGFPSTRINLSPFTKDFRGGEQLNESLV